jgi:hypothetical protein
MIVSLIVAGAVGLTVRAEEALSAGGIDFEPSLERRVADKDVTLTATGAGVRERFLLTIYAVASYVQEGAELKSAEDLAAADCPKCLHLVMVRTVGGKDMADAFRASIRANYPAPALHKELERLGRLIEKQTAKKGDHIWLTHIPGVGLECDFGGQVFTIKNPEFARAVWDIWLGPKNLGEGLKKSLVNRL